jgi:hypothetical protein
MAALAVIGALWAAAPSHAEALTCRSVDGNVVCAGRGGSACQTINGRTTCVKGPDMACDRVAGRTTCSNGSAVQSYGSGAPSEDDEDEDRAADEATAPAVPGGPAATAERLHIERRDALSGRTLSIDRDGRRLHLRNGSVELDIGGR